jgi:hypothetical protein
VHDVEAAIERVRESRASHVAWADHLAECQHCQAHPPQHVHGAEEQQRIVAEYDNVLACLAVLRSGRKTRNASVDAFDYTEADLHEQHPDRFRRRGTPEPPERPAPLPNPVVRSDS